MRQLALHRAEETVHGAGDRLAPHRHAVGYLALVLTGAYEELSPDGRFQVEAGLLIAHPPFHLHGNKFGGKGARVLNLPWPKGACFDYRVARIARLDSIARLARRDPLAAADLARESLNHAANIRLERLAAPPWAEALAEALRGDALAGAGERIGRRVRQVGVSAEHAARTFKHYFGLSPSAYRREHRARRALSMLQQGARPAATAVECGFFDQSHLNREIRRATGRTPGRIDAPE